MGGQGNTRELLRRWLSRGGSGWVWLTGRIRVGKKKIRVVVSGSAVEGVVGRTQGAVAVAVPLNGYAKLAIEQALQYGDVNNVVSRRSDIVMVSYYTVIRADGRRVVIDMPREIAYILQRLGVDDLRNRWVAIWLIHRVFIPSRNFMRLNALIWVKQGRALTMPR